MNSMCQSYLQLKSHAAHKKNNLLINKDLKLMVQYLLIQKNKSINLSFQASQLVLII